MPRPATVPMLLGRRLRALRTLRGLTQEQLGERAGLSGKFLGQVERGVGNPSLQILIRLAQALEVELWELLRLEEARPDGTPATPPAPSPPPRWSPSTSPAAPPPTWSAP